MKRCSPRASLRASPRASARVPGAGRSSENVEIQDPDIGNPSSGSCNTYREGQSHRIFCAGSCIADSQSGTLYGTSVEAFWGLTVDMLSWL